MSIKGTLFTHSSDEYVRYTTQTSTVVRAVAIAGIGIVWLYRPASTKDILAGFADQLTGERVLLAGFTCFLLALIFDLSQYACASFGWFRYQNLIRKILAADDLSRNIPNPEAARLWSRKHARQLAYFIVRSGKDLNPSIYGNIKSSSDDNQIVWLARRLLHDPKRYGVSASDFTKSLAVPWSPGWVTGVTDVFFWLKIVLSIAGYILLVFAAFGGG